MATRRFAALAGALFIGGCAAVYPYPMAWDPLLPPTSTDCNQYQGSYSDKADSPDRVKPSLTRELFGFNTDWETGTRVDFSFPLDDALEVTVWAGAEKLFTRTLTAAEGEVACDAGRLIVRNKRWVRSDVLLAHEKATLTLQKSGDYLVAQVEERTTGLFFVIVPIMGTTTHWYRFARL
ncbi:MAG TPA: hypothetical protein VN929_08330 [Burkholderiales bacterium]|nr:hypothetical protein [Burkholderiales bacterium]